MRTCENGLRCYADRTFFMLEILGLLLLKTFASGCAYAKATPMTSDVSTLYGEIEQLAATRSRQELTGALQKILDKLTYYTIVSEGAALEDREEWRGAFTEQLHADRTEAERSPHAQTGAKRPSARRPEPRKAEQPAGPPPSLMLPPASSVPPALRAILDGTHPSFREDY